jgi:DNA-binding transcriptional ArsR family regulator
MEMETAIQCLAALSQDTRLRAFRLLVREGAEGMAAGDIARALGQPPSTLSAHLSILANAGLIRATRRSRSIIYTLEAEEVRALLAFLLEDCCRGRPDLCAPLLDTVLADCCAPSDNQPVPAERN